MAALLAYNILSCAFSSGPPDAHPGAILDFWTMPTSVFSFARLEVEADILLYIDFCAITLPILAWRKALAQHQQKVNNLIGGRYLADLLGQRNPGARVQVCGIGFL